MILLEIGLMTDGPLLAFASANVSFLSDNANSIFLNTIHWRGNLRILWINRVARNCGRVRVSFSMKKDDRKICNRLSV